MLILNMAQKMQSLRYSHAVERCHHKHKSCQLYHHQSSRQYPAQNHCLNHQIEHAPKFDQLIQQYLTEFLENLEPDARQHYFDQI